MDDSLSLQIDEVETLSSIYGDEFTVLNVVERTYLISIKSCVDDNSCSVDLKIILPDDYPTSSPPAFKLITKELNDIEILALEDNLGQLWIDNMGDNILYTWVESIREFLNDKVERSKLLDDNVKADSYQDETPSVIRAVFEETPLEKELEQEQNTLDKGFPNIEVPDICHGEPFVDRKSTFQAHASVVANMDEVKLVQNELLKNRKIAHATHNIMAYRITTSSSSVILQDCDDDGETAAGGRLLHLLNILDMKNIIVVVSRWYGGIHLGPDRFKHINNVARSLLVQKGLVKVNESKTKKENKKITATKSKKH